jgi:hypothetical protein
MTYYKRELPDTADPKHNDGVDQGLGQKPDLFLGAYFMAL